MVLNELIELSGFVTKQIFLQGKTLSEIEDLLGFQKGRLHRGATFLVAMSLPNEDGFDFAGYSQVAAHHTKEQYGNLNTTTTKHEKDAYLQRKKSVIATWSLFGSDRLVKVIPTLEHNKEIHPDKQYPPGAGIPQWVIKREASCKFKVISILKDSDYPSGKFIPDQGYTKVIYK